MCRRQGGELEVCSRSQACKTAFVGRGVLVQEGKEYRRVKIEAAGKSPPDTDFLSCKEVTAWARQALPLALVLNCTHKEQLPSEMASQRCGTWDQPVL